MSNSYFISKRTMIRQCAKAEGYKTTVL